MLYPNTCEFCSCESFIKVFEFFKPPKLETVFPSLNLQKYYREIIECENCGHLLSIHRMDLSKLYLGDYNNSTYHGLEGMLATLDKISKLPKGKSDNQGRCDFIENFLREFWNGIQPNDLKVIDIGSGLGVFPLEMKNRGYIVTALDPDPTSIKHIENNVGVATICGDFFKIRTSEKFDLLTLNKVLEHVLEPISMLQKAGECIKDSGLIYLELPDGETAKLDGLDREEFVIDHLHVFSLSSVMHLASKANLKILEIQRIKEPSTKYTIRAILEKFI